MLVKVITLALVMTSLLALASSQRPSYAGSRPPLGNKDKYRPTQSPASIELANRFGNDGLANGASQRPPQGVPVVQAENGYTPLLNEKDPTINNRINGDVVTSNAAAVPGAGNPIRAPSRLPLDAHGDQELVNHLSRLPIDQQPFWLVNYQAIEAHRNGSGKNIGAIASRGSFFGK